MPRTRLTTYDEIDRLGGVLLADEVLATAPAGVSFAGLVRLVDAIRSGQVLAYLATDDYGQTAGVFMAEEPDVDSVIVHAAWLRHSRPAPVTVFPELVSEVLAQWPQTRRIVAVVPTVNRPANLLARRLGGRYVGEQSWVFAGRPMLCRRYELELT